MCTGFCIDNIIVCPFCKRDDEAFKLGESDSPFKALDDKRMQCLCSRIFPVDENKTNREMTC